MIADFRLSQDSRHASTPDRGALVAPATDVNLPSPSFLLVLALSPPLAAAQPTSDDRDHCAVYGDADVVVLGRPQTPVVIHFSGERVIERARQELARVEADVERIRGLLSPQQRLEQEASLELRVADAMNQFSHTVAMYPPPMDIPFVPVHVERTLRGMPSSPFMARIIDDTRLEADRLYVIRGMRSTDLLAFPEMTDVPLTEYVVVVQAQEGALARRAVQFLQSTASGATILGQIKMESIGDGIVDGTTITPPLLGARIAASVGGWRGDVPIDDNGEFVFTSLPAGRVELQATLPAGLTLVGQPVPAADLVEGSCHVVQLTAQRNGRVRGRIVNVPEAARGGITLALDARISPGRGPGEIRVTSVGFHREIAVQEDGTFAFVGVPPGSYTLFARYQRTPQTTPPWPVTYFPGTRELAHAVKIEVGDATEHDGLDFAVYLDDALRENR